MWIVVSVTPCAFDEFAPPAVVVVWATAEVASDTDRTAAVTTVAAASKRFMEIPPGCRFRRGAGAVALL
jgi:hypothetical protein